ncbi:hypothetical protein LIPSTDRAFT_241220 [Lipomyces starkeyi NRRL Y-11557]|uniref:Uncharacterized protein n=1 Tax=Lipomyces starkeyi NRRL Y-11557 TaxID=675824 RepID=A0A1E3QC00_LIPST|nr:hypothetical protein LIPSTDRAFT_241220 [Lipomyces starkeyi NRRL Y-11557]
MSKTHRHLESRFDFYFAPQSFTSSMTALRAHGCLRTNFFCCQSVKGVLFVHFVCALGVEFRVTWFWNIHVV